ncbi:MAG: hypothetical protein AAFR22_20975, partial [Chloroflexota bacterium]
LADHEKAVQQSFEMICTMPHRVDIIADYSKGTPPQNIFRRTLLAKLRAPENYGQCFVFGYSEYGRQVLYLLSRLPATRGSLVYVDSFEDAVEQIILQRRHT